MTPDKEINPPKANINAIESSLDITTVDSDLELEFNRVLEFVEKLQIDYQSLNLAREISRYGNT